jgi:hypothetical protein
MQALVRGLLWPVVTLLVIGTTHLLAEVVRPGLKDVIGPSVVAPIYLAVGAWAALSTRRAGGGWVQGIMAGVVLGFLPLALQMVGFGVLLGRDGDAVLTSGLFGLLAMTWGGAIGSGFAGTLPERPATLSVTTRADA